MRSYLNQRSGRSGFTLIELLVVIAIIGILAAIVLVSLNTARVRGRDARRVGDLASLAAALEIYADTYGLYPEPNTAGTTFYANFSNMVGQLQAAGLLATSPQDPVNVGNQQYAYGGTDNGPPIAYTVTTGTCIPAALGYIMRAALERDSASAARDNNCANYDPPIGPTGALDCSASSAGNYQYCLYQSSGA